ncbi:hypothetical protein A3A76_05375 [Candidatus Woesebacteria bacterium RIFCSPLOWO2_01_FULL_39_23]|nr:MAG: hypothetical protein A3E41_02790 [Candidatus Woesebacteria bacterium RIFCSPHIGHO2_12_FULL_38_9]OGM62284.1 MAG: hypothetical protein A3A76_05375 [Candidatus Woesebacteria bacterium RIFCSPLOWO2_01_FULL_39_23]
MRFNDLLIEGLESEHMNYHLKRLIDVNYVVKEGSLYKLTDIGKDYSNLLDEKTDLVERQPKTSVVLHIKRKNKNGEIEHLLLKRLRHPYFGKVGHLTGKVKFGETFLDAAKRELYEETGLSAKTFILEKIYRKMRKRSKEFIQDVVFYQFLITGINGTLIGKTEFQENFWVTKKEAKTRPDLDFFDDFLIETSLSDSLKPKKLVFVESLGEAEGY